MIPAAVQRYLSCRAVAGPWTLQGEEGGGYCGAVVIPSLAERENLQEVLSSLAQNPPEALAECLVVVVVNSSPLSSAGEKDDNLATLADLEKVQGGSPLRLSWVDAASPGRELPVRDAGVGLARKIGIDLALQRLDFRREPILVCLDADAVVESTYLPALLRHFSASPQGGASLPFRHREPEDAVHREAIRRYELFLRAYVLGLSAARSPYAFHTVGSAMACTAAAYVRCGGMNRRKAGEDFYFLQALAKSDGVCQVRGTTVHPSPRISRRVPFGTGRKMADVLEGGKEILAHDPRCFAVVGSFLRIVERERGASAIMGKARELSPVLAEFLEGNGFLQAWERLAASNAGERLLPAFHCWFDAFRTMKLVHLLSERECGPVPVERAVSGLLAGASLRLEDQLELLRSLQA